MPLITLQNVDYSVGGPLLLEHVDFTIEPGHQELKLPRRGASLGKATFEIRAEWAHISHSEASALREEVGSV